MMRVREATPTDARAILADLSDITRADIAAHGMNDAQLSEQVDWYFVNGTAHALDEDGKALCVVGVCWMGDYWNCWLLAREGFWSVRPSIWRNLRRYAQLALSGMREEVHSYSASPHPALSRWMGAIGFEEAGSDGKFRHFIFPR